MSNYNVAEIYKRISSDCIIYVFTKNNLTRRCCDSVLVCIQNLSTRCRIETQFVSQCLFIYTNFRGINEDLRNLKERNVNRIRLPFLVDLSGTAREIYEKSTQCVRYDNDFRRSRFESHTTANTVETLSTGSWFIR